MRADYRARFLASMIVNSQRTSKDQPIRYPGDFEPFFEFVPREVRKTSNVRDGISEDSFQQHKRAMLAYGKQSRVEKVVHR